MPQLTLPDALRYFFAPFVICFCYFVYDPKSAETYARNFGPLGPISFLVAGSTLYYVYRALIYDAVILLVYDRVRKKTHRAILIKRYDIPVGPIGVEATRVAARILHRMTDNASFSDALQKRNRPMRAAGIHMLYQAGTCAFFFLLLSIAAAAQKHSTLAHSVEKAALFGVLFLILLGTAIKMDIEFEDEMVLLVESLPNVADEAASALGIRKPPITSETHRTAAEGLAR